MAIAHDGTCPKLLKTWQGDDKVFDGRRVLVTVDHAFPAPSPADREFQRRLADFAKEQGIALYNHGEGVLHQVIAEKVALWPGMIIAGADGHVATSGAFGALAFALTPEELYPVLTSGNLQVKVPEVITFELVGDLKFDTMPRDIALYILGNYHTQIKGKAVALQGEFLSNLPAADRMTICNLLPEGGAVTAFCVPEGEQHDVVDHRVDVGGLEPMVAVPPEPVLVKPLRELAGTPINVAIVGGCSAGRIEDMEAVAEVLATQRVHSDVTLLITPASQKVAGEMDARGFSALFREKGAVILPPGCGPCPGKHFGVLAPGDIAIATIVRNTPGRMGSPDAQIYLGSPHTVALAAVQGKL